MRQIVLVLILAFALTGCGTMELVEVIEENVYQEDEASIPGSWVLYENERYGYSFSYPKEAILFADVTEDLQIVPVSSQDSLIKVTDASEIMLLQTEVNIISVEVIEDARSAHEWISLHLDSYYPEGVAGQSIGEFAGQEAIILRGTGSQGSPEKVVTLSRNDVVYVISYGFSSITFENILDTFEFF